MRYFPCILCCKVEIPNGTGFQGSERLTTLCSCFLPRECKDFSLYATLFTHNLIFQRNKMYLDVQLGYSSTKNGLKILSINSNERNISKDGSQVQFYGIHSSLLLPNNFVCLFGNSFLSRKIHENRRSPVLKKSHALLNK